MIPSSTVTEGLHTICSQQTFETFHIAKAELTSTILGEREAIFPVRPHRRNIQDNVACHFKHPGARRELQITNK